MQKLHFSMGASAKGVLAALTLSVGMLAISSCSDDDGLTAGDANYFTTSRGQFTATLDDGTKLFLLSGKVAGEAALTYDGDNPRHWASSTSANVNIETYSGNLELPETMAGSDGKTYVLTTIGDEAFMGCRKLTSLVLPETVTSFGEGAFAICNNLASINIPEGITEIPVGCFGYCQKLVNVTLPYTVTTIEKMAFHGCNGLSAITLPENLTKIGDQAFFDCNKLTTMTIPASVKTIGDRAFGGRDATSRSIITAYHMQGAVPPTLEGTLFEAQDGIEPVIYVPSDAIDAYRSAPGWSSLNIEEE